MIGHVLARNRTSPWNEDDYRRAYLKVNPSAERKDGYDIACVITQYGTYGHGLMLASENRRKDNLLHDVYDFVADTDLVRFI